MGGVNYTVDHDRFVTKNKPLAASMRIDKKDRDLEKKGFSHIERQQEASCFNCKRKSKCPEFRSRRTGGVSGAASFGGDEKTICAKYEPAPKERRGMSDKQIKSLMKNFKRGH